MIVVDTNIITYLYIQGEHTAETEAVLKKDPDWKVPILWRSEFRNVLAFYVRKKILSLELALRIVSQAEEQLKGNEYLVPSDQVLVLASRSRLSAYDCEFVALAQELEVPFVTSDRKVISRFPTTAVAVKDFE